jgi:hypothetical protein
MKKRLEKNPEIQWKSMDHKKAKAEKDNLKKAIKA